MKVRGLFGPMTGNVEPKLRGARDCSRAITAVDLFIAGDFAGHGELNHESLPT
jgi:hypothetical protein